MIIQFPEYLDYKYFYRFSLKKLMAFANMHGDDELIIDLQNTTHMTPSVICDLLSFFNYLGKSKDSRVWIMFGKSRRLSSYLNDSHFFLYSDNWRLFSTDLLSFNNTNNDIRKSINTDKINRVPIPLNSGKDLPFSVIKQIQQRIYMLYSSEKAQGMFQHGLSNPGRLATGYIEIIENSYEHTYEHSPHGVANDSGAGNCCYFTFQNYIKTGLSFANSDIGMGFFRSLEIKYLTDPTQEPKLFSLEEFLGFKKSSVERNLAGILESIVLRVAEDSKADYGFPFILGTLVLPCNGVLVVHSGDVLLEIDTDFLYNYFIVNDLRLVGYNKQKLRDIMFDIKARKELVAKGTLRLFDYSFPGVHMAVQIGRRQMY